MRKKYQLFVLVILGLMNSTIVVQGVPIILSHTNVQTEVLPIRSQQIDILIDNGYVVTNVSQDFYNPYEINIQGTYMFALPDDAFISNFSLTIEGSKHYGTILLKEEAREQYQEAVEAGRTAALLEYVDRKLFSYAVSIAPNEYLIVELVYEQALKKEFNTYTYIHPLETKGYDVKVESLVMNIDIQSQTTISNINVQGYTFSTTTLTDHLVRLQYAKENVMPESDLQLTYDVASIPIEGTLLVKNRDGTNYFMYTFAPFPDEIEADSLPKDVVFVIDKSGSMSGEKMVQTKDAMLNILPQMNSNDRFSIVFYDSMIWTRGMVLANSENIRDASNFVKNLAAGGGTNIDTALKTAFDMFPISDRLKLMVFMTDGLPTAGITDKSIIVSNVAADYYKIDAKIYSFGFGWELDMDLLQKISTKTNGEATRIHPSQNIEEQLSGFFKTISVPLLRDISIDFGSEVEDILPQEIPILYYGSEVIVVGKYQGEGPMSVSITSESAQKPETYKGTFNITDPDLIHSFVPKLWAIHKINFLLDQMLLEGEIQRFIDEIVELSIEYGLVTPYTSILIDPEALQEEVSQEDLLKEGTDSTSSPSLTINPPATITTPGAITYVVTATDVMTTVTTVPEIGRIYLFIGILLSFIYVLRGIKYKKKSKCD